MMLLQDDKDRHIRELAKRVAFTILDSNFFRRIVRETVLRVLVEREQLQKIGFVQAFLDECSARRISVTLKPEDERLYFRLPAYMERRLPADLQAMLTLYRADIIQHLAYINRMEAAQQKAGSNGTGQTTAAHERGRPGTPGNG